MQQQVRAEEVTIQQVEKEHEVKVQEAEIMRRERELTATVLKPAEAERQRIETLAEAEKQRLIMEAEGHASAIRAQGEAEAEIIFKKGEAEAKAMNVKAEAYQEFNQAAIVDKLITGMPEMVRALAAPLANVDKITIVSTGNGDTAGMNKITGDMAKMAAQIPALFETLSGMPFSELFCEGADDRRQIAEGRGQGQSGGARGTAPQAVRGPIRKGEFHGTLRASLDIDSGESQRPGGQGRRSGEDDQAGDSRHGEPVVAGQDPGGDLHRRPARAGEEAGGKRGERAAVDAPGGDGAWTSTTTPWRAPPWSAR